MLIGRNADIAMGVALAIVFLKYGDNLPLVKMIHAPVIDFVNSTGY